MRLADVVTVLDRLFPPSLAEEWDAVGLVVGDPDAEVRRIHLAVDPVEAVAEEALALGADLLLVHHPLYLRGTTTVAATTPKGRVVHRLLSGGCALHVAHTNADSARPGVSDALADLFGLTGTVPLAPQPGPALDGLVTYVPTADAPRVLDALAAAGAGALGDYEACAFTSPGTGRFRPLEGARPTVGQVGRLELVEEVRIETLVVRERRSAVLAALRAAHPYEEPAFELVERADLPGDLGLGRVGALPAPLRLAELVARAAQVLPATGWGVRASGDPDQVVERLAVSGGAGDSLLGAAARSGAQAFLTSDLRHHPASDAPDGLALLDAAHWATEAPWCAATAERLRTLLGPTVSVSVSALVTDPFGLHQSQSSDPDPRSPSA